LAYFLGQKGKAFFTVANVVEQFKLALRGADALLVALCAIKMLHRVNDGTGWGTEAYSITKEAAEYLDPENEFFIGGLLEMEYQNYITPAGLVEALKTGKPKAGGGDIFNTDVDSTKTFLKGMHSISARPAEFLTRLFPFEKYNCILDVGGGSGVFLVHILQKFPNMTGILLDLKHPCLIANEIFNENKISDRTQTAALDMFQDPWPSHFSFATSSTNKTVDIVFFSQVLHDWPEDFGKKLLQKAYHVLPPKGVVMINEKLLDDDRTGPVATAMVNISMLYWVEGQQYTKGKLEELLLSVGFKNIKLLKTVSYWSVVYGEK